MSEIPKTGLPFGSIVVHHHYKTSLRNAELIENKVGRENTLDIIGPYHNTTKKVKRRTDLADLLKRKDLSPGFPVVCFSHNFTSICPNVRPLPMKAVDTFAEIFVMMSV